MNIALQPFLWFGVVGFPVSEANAVGFGLFALLLVVGAGYWWAKLRQLAAPAAGLPYLRGFIGARVVTAVVLVAGLVFVVVEVAVAPGRGSWPGLGFGLFAALEYVNYFFVQLMYDNKADLRYLFTHGLRRSHLAADIARGKSGERHMSWAEV
ncbi:hypothetical protein [Nocardia sp. NPDC052566]|uniref:hypothetical protein n=1 Tax=Nocardia sp. NPDC052566 TaxID=3364330 RepID=UPI0037C70577